MGISTLPPDQSVSSFIIIILTSHTTNYTCIQTNMFALLLTLPLFFSFICLFSFFSCSMQEQTQRIKRERGKHTTDQKLVHELCLLYVQGDPKPTSKPGIAFEANSKKTDANRETRTWNFEEHSKPTSPNSNYVRTKVHTHNKICAQRCFIDVCTHDDIFLLFFVFLCCFVLSIYHRS